jgi:Skp family chaperone for outer membrane proteins
LKKKATTDKKAEEKEKKIIAEIQKKLDANMAALQKEPPISKINKQVEMQLSNAYAKKRSEYEQLLHQEANVVLESVEEPMQTASSSSVDDIQFLAESQDDIANLTPPIRLSQD